MRGFTFKFKLDTDYKKQRSIDTMTPNKLAVYFVADMVLAYMVVAGVDFPCGRYGFFCCGRYRLAVADMVAPPDKIPQLRW